MNAAPNTLARALRTFFADHLPRVRGVSPHTVQSYRDSLVLLLRFVAARRNHSVTTLDLKDLGTAEVLDFLRHLETDRHNTAGTRNVRLSAIHAFVRYCATIHPESLEHCQRVLAVPFKRTRSRAVEYLDYDEIKTVLATTNRATPDGRRDYALLATMFNTGARVQEVVGIRRCDLQLEMQPHVRLFGKGRKERLCPLWPQTAELLSGLLAHPQGEPRPEAPVFLNHRGERLTRFGIRYILGKYCARHGSHAHVEGEAPAPAQHEAQYGRTPSEGRCRSRDDQSLAGPRQYRRHESLHQRRSGDEARRH
ncbi:MAG: tyrosine-type recombinase/integrase [Microbacterium sp.]|nr:tyrosine-type recombinase/integrase [Microbacterium sp.]MDP3951558.1 tyrosine-type recombinase/integrase [Microbacterium sp.]